MPSRKRTRAEADAEENGAPQPTPKDEKPSQTDGLLSQLRNMWEFANLMQYIFTFGKLVKISDSIEIDDLETECLKPGPSQVLLDIGLSLLKFVSSHRGLTYENFEEYTRRQYYAKAPARNPFGDDEQPIKFNDFDVFQKIRILQQLSAWTFWNPDRIREKMPEQKETEQAQWRVEEVGYDRQERVYYVLDDNRLYRRTDPPIPPPKAPKPKANSKRGRALARAAKKRKLSEAANEVNEEGEENVNDAEEDDLSKGYKWECVAVTLAEYQSFLASIQKTKDPNEKILRDSLTENVIPVLEQVEEAQRRKMQRREKELINMQKMANAKRSSRVAEKQERERQAMQAAEEERRLEAERIAAKKEEEKMKKIEEERLYRLMGREQRLKDREEKRKQREEQLARMTEQAKQPESSNSRVSERQLKAEMAKREHALAELQAEEEQWFFDCSGCGVHGENLDDGSHSVACEKCNVWQHSRCLGIPQEEAEKDDFHFICKDCKQRIEDAKRPKLPPLKFRIQKPTSPPPPDQAVTVKGENQFPAPKTETPAVEIPQPNTSATLNGARTASSHAVPGQYNPAQAQPKATGPTHSSVNGSQHHPQQMQNVTVYQPLPQQGQPMPQTATGSIPSQYSARPNMGHAQPAQQNPPFKFVQQYQPGPAGAPPSSSATTSFSSQPRPSSSHSKSSPAPSPIQNRPSMSPTQGNRDVGPLAGIPHVASQSNGTTLPSTPFGSQSQSQNQTQNRPPSRSPYPVGPPPNQASPHSQSFSSTATPRHNATAAGGPSSSVMQTPPSTQNHYSPGMPMSGLSPTKHSSPPQPAPSSSFSSGDGSGKAHAAVLPPVQKLQPSPELMGRSSADEPIPAPMKAMNIGAGMNMGIDQQGQRSTVPPQPQPPQQQQHPSPKHNQPKTGQT